MNFASKFRISRGVAANAAAACSCGLQSADGVPIGDEVPNGTTAKANRIRFRPIRDFESSSDHQPHVET